MTAIHSTTGKIITNSSIVLGLITIHSIITVWVTVNPINKGWIIM